MRTARMGFWSAITATTFGLLYILALLLSLAGLLHKPWDTFWQLLPSIFLAWAFMSLMACHYRSVPSERSVYALVGLALCIIYATINSIVYFTELTVVIPGINSGKESQLELLLFEPGKFLFAINGLAYTLMSMATLVASGSFRGTGKEAKLKWTMIAHGLVGPFIFGALLWPPLTYVGALWIISFPAFGIASILYHRQQ